MNGFESCEETEWRARAYGAVVKGNADYSLLSPRGGAGGTLKQLHRRIWRTIPPNHPTVTLRPLSNCPLWFPSLPPSSHPMPSQRTWNPKFSQALILRLPSRQLEPRGGKNNQLFVTVRCGTLPVVSRISMYTSPLTNTSSEASLSFLQSLWTSF